jgi:hypothetical protein
MGREWKRQGPSAGLFYWCSAFDAPRLVGGPGVPKHVPHRRAPEVDTWHACGPFVLFGDGGCRRRE